MEEQLITLKLRGCQAARLSIDTIVFVGNFVDVYGEEYLSYITDCERLEELESVIFKAQDVPVLVMDLVALIMKYGGSRIDDDLLVWGKCLYNYSMPEECFIQLQPTDTYLIINTKHVPCCSSEYVPRFSRYIRTLCDYPNTTCRMLRRLPWQVDLLYHSRH